MNRREFLGQAVAAAATAAATRPAAAIANEIKHPRAITMWEFSWIERRWPGAGYEDWDRALDELRERGYNAVRIDPFPHLLAANPHKTWTLQPEWSTQVWGSPDVNRIVLVPALFEFIRKCRDRGIKVGLSTWYRKDNDDTRMKITGPDVMAANWIKTLDMIKEAGLIESILYTDLCNEWPGEDWAPFMKPLTYGQWADPRSLDFMHKSIALVRQKYPSIPLFYSIATGPDPALLNHDLSDFDLLDPHIWMTQQNNGEFYKLTGYAYERFDNKGYANLNLKADDAYRARPQYWQNLLIKAIDDFAGISRKIRMPLITTECWAIVDYKDWPLLKWDWVKDLCALGTQHAASSGRWLAVATSNFCGPQFVGMWRDVAWHQRLTREIKSAAIAPELQRGRLYEKL
jgi:hypothetical protein